MIASNRLAKDFYHKSKTHRQEATGALENAV
jgi:hypothetical protein